MKPSFYLDLFQGHLARSIEAQRALGSSTGGADRGAALDGAYNALQEAADSINGHATTVARELVELDGERRKLLDRIETDEADFDFEEVAHPIEAFWKQPWNVFQNIGLFPLRLIEWVTRRRVPRHRDLIQSLAQGNGQGRLEHLQAQAAEVDRGVERVTRRRPRPGRPDAPVPDLATAGAGRVERLRAGAERRWQTRQRIEISGERIAGMPQASDAEKIYAERVRGYGLVLSAIEGAVAEMDECRSIAEAIEATRRQMEERNPGLAEWRLSRIVTDDRSRRFLDSVRDLLGALARLTGHAPSPNVEVVAPGRALPGVLRVERRLPRARRARLGSWRTGRSRPDRRTARRLAHLREREADRLRVLRQGTVEDPAPFDRFFTQLRGLLGTITRRVRDPVALYFGWVDDYQRFLRRVLGNATEIALVGVLGGLVYRVVAAATAAAIGVLGLPWWIVYSWRGRRAQALRAEGEKVLREFAEEIVDMAGGLLVPGERMADHLLGRTSCRRANGPAPSDPLFVAAIGREVQGLLADLHRVHSHHLSFTAPQVDYSSSSRLTRGIDESERAVRARRAAIRQLLEDAEAACRGDARRLAAIAAAMSGFPEPSRDELLRDLLRLHETMVVAGLDPAAIEPLVGQAASATGRKRFLFWESGCDVSRLAQLVHRATSTLDSTERMGNGPESRFGRQVVKALGAIARQRHGEADSALDAAAP